MTVDEADLKRQIHAAMVRSEFEAVKNLLAQLDRFIADLPDGRDKERLKKEADQLWGSLRRRKGGTAPSV